MSDDPILLITETVVTTGTPEFVVTDDGIVCPNEACGAVNSVVEVDYCIRENAVEVEVREDGVYLYPDDSDRDMTTAHWKCKACGTAAHVPGTVDVVYG